MPMRKRGQPYAWRTWDSQWDMQYDTVPGVWLHDQLADVRGRFRGSALTDTVERQMRMERCGPLFLNWLALYWAIATDNFNNEPWTEEPAWWAAGRKPAMDVIAALNGGRYGAYERRSDDGYLAAAREA